VGIGKGKAQPDADGADQHRERGQSVYAGVQTIGHQRGRADPSASANTHERRKLVAQETDQRTGFPVLSSAGRMPTADILPCGQYLVKRF